MQSQKPKRSLPVPPSTQHADRSPSHYRERDSRGSDQDPNLPTDKYSSSEVRRMEYQSSHADAHSLMPNYNSSKYDSVRNPRDSSPRSYHDNHSTRIGRNESPHITDRHKSNSSHSLKRDSQQRSHSIEQQNSRHLSFCPTDDYAHGHYSTMQTSPNHNFSRYSSEYHPDAQLRAPLISETASAAWQRSSLPARTRPRSPSSPGHSWQRSSLPAHARHRLSPSHGSFSASPRITENHVSPNRYPISPDNHSDNRPPLMSSRSEPYSSSFKKRQSETRNMNLGSYGQQKDHRKSKYDKEIKDANAPYEVHFKHRRNSSLEAPTHIESKMKRSSTNYRDFLHSASLDDHARAAMQKEAEEDEAYKVLKEGLKIAKSRVVYQFERSMSKEDEQIPLSQEQQMHRNQNFRRIDDYDREYDRYRQPSMQHEIYQSRGELDRMSHHSSRSNPLENHSNSYRHNPRPYATHDPYTYSPLSYNHHITSNYDPGSHVTQTSTQTDETSLSPPYNGYTTIPNQYRWVEDNKQIKQRNFFSFFNCNFLRNRKVKNKSTDTKFIYMNSPAPQHFTQVLATLAVALGPLCAGLGKGYSSPALASMAALSAQGQHFSISKDQGSWVASLSLLGAFFGSLPAGMSIRYGRKRVLCLVAVPFALSWVLTVVATNVYMLYAASLLGGVCTAIIAVVTPVYISEIAHPDIRGCLCALSKLSSNIGMLLSYLLGAFLNWRQLATVTAIAPACLFLAALLIPETPSYLLYRGRDTEAAASLAWLRSGRDVARELTTMKANIATLRRHEVQEPPSVAFRDLVRPLFITCGLMVFQKFSGANAFNFYAVPILSETFVGLDPYRAAVVVAFVQICAGMASSALVDTVGRRPLLVFSNMLMSAALAAFGGYVYLKGLDTNEDMFARQQWRQSDWVPLFCILVIEIAFALGVSPISWLYIGELFPLKHRGFGALAASVSYACSFASVKSFVDLQLALGLYGTFWLYSSLSALALVFTLLFVPETKGLSLQEMQEQHKSVFI